MTSQQRNTNIRVAVGISLAALCNLAQASAAPEGVKKGVVHSVDSDPVETVSQDEAPRCDPSYPTLAAGWFAVLQSQYGPESTKEGGAGGEVAKRLPPCEGLPVSREISPTIRVPGLTGRTRTRYTYTLGNEMGLPWWAFNPCRTCQGAGRVSRGWVPLWSVETTEREGDGVPLPR